MRFFKSCLAMILLCFLPLTVLSGCGPGIKADLLLTNGEIFTGNEDGVLAEAVAVKDGKIIFVGKSVDAGKYINSSTQVIDLEGKFVIPGMMDTHIHAPGTALAELYQINLHEALTEEETMETIKQFIEAHPELDIYYGEGFSVGAFSGEEVSLGPKKERLDEICPDKPVIIYSLDGHITWLNSAALKKFNITEETLDPPGGRIERDPISGELWGTLKEAAQALVSSQEFSFEQRVEALQVFQEKMNSLGYTGILSISGDSLTPLEEYKTLEDRGELNLRVQASMTIDPQEDIQSQIQSLKELESRYNSELIKVRTAKFFADGVVEGVTAYLLEPYTIEGGKGENYRGEFLWDLEKMKEAFRLVLDNGFQIHVHSIGDGATRNVLDALEYAQKNTEQRDFRNTITHLQLVSEEDIERFKNLDVIASTQPYWHFKEPEWWEPVDHTLLGDRAEYEYPLGSFFRKGVVVASSSDHPVTPIPNPFWAIEAGVTRNLNNPDFYGVEEISSIVDPLYLLNKNERASVEEMLRSFTANAAYLTFQEKELGTIEVGKLADLVVLDQNILKVDPLKIDSTRVLKTIFGGKVVYEYQE